MCHSVLSLLVHKGIFVLPIAKEICVVSSLISPVPVAARSKAYVCGRSPVEIVGSVPTGGGGGGGGHGCLSVVSVVCCQVEDSTTS